MPVSFEELEGSPTIAINADGMQATRVFRVAWSDWQDFVRDLTGGWRPVGDSFELIEPKSFPGLDNVVIDEVHITPLDPHNPDGQEVQTLTRGTNSYPQAGAKVVATYKSRADADPENDDPDIPKGTVLTYSSDLGGETITIPGRAYTWGAGGDKLPADVNPGVFMPTGSYTLKWDRVASPPWSAIRNTRGKINSTAFHGAAARTVLFLGARASRQFEFLHGATLWSLEYSFAERAVEWNKFFRVETGVWTEINPKPYAEASFSNLFTFG